MSEVPIWVKKDHQHHVWSEDDAGAPDTERIGTAWKRVFGIHRHEEVIADKYDAGDADYILYESGRVACVSYPGNSEIYLFYDPCKKETSDHV